MNYFIEGLQGSGKSTLVQKLHEKYPNHSVFREGDYSPVELAWCAYVSKDEYEKILEKYSGIKQEIINKSHEEDGYKVICYTQIITDVPGFHKDLEQYEIYNGRVRAENFRKTILRRYNHWQGDECIFECSIFQNIVEDMILFQNLSDDEIIAFYREIKDALGDRDYKILYLESEDIAGNINTIRKERSDDKGNELWFPLMMNYFNESPYATKNKVSGEEALLAHFKHRQELELRICEEVFRARYVVLKSKGYDEGELI
jgi:hypothetical protein